MECLNIRSFNIDILPQLIFDNYLHNRCLVFICGYLVCMIVLFNFLILYSLICLLIHLKLQTC